MDFENLANWHQFTLRRLYHLRRLALHTLSLLVLAYRTRDDDDNELP